MALLREVLSKLNKVADANEPPWVLFGQKLHQLLFFVEADELSLYRTPQELLSHVRCHSDSDWALCLAGLVVISETAGVTSQRHLPQCRRPRRPPAGWMDIAVLVERSLAPAWARGLCQWAA